MAADAVYSEAMEAKSRVATAAFLAFAAAVRVDLGDEAVDALAAHSGTGVKLRWLRKESAVAAAAAAAAVQAAGGAAGKRGRKAALHDGVAESFDDIPAGIAASRAQGALIVERGGCQAGSSTVESIRVLRTRGGGDSSELLATITPSEVEHADPVCPAEAVVALAAVAPHVAARTLKAWSGLVRRRVMAPALDLLAVRGRSASSSGSRREAFSGEEAMGSSSALALSGGAGPSSSPVEAMDREEAGAPSAALARFTDAQKAVVAAVSTSIPPLQMGGVPQQTVDSAIVTSEEAEAARAAAFASLGDVAAVAAAAVGTVPEPVLRRWKQAEEDAAEQGGRVGGPSLGAGSGGGAGPDGAGDEGGTGPISFDITGGKAVASVSPESSASDVGELEAIREQGRALRGVVSSKVTQLVAACLWRDGHEADGVLRSWAASCPGLLKLWEAEQSESDEWWEAAAAEDTLVEWTKYGEEPGGEASSVRLGSAEAVDAAVA